MRGGLQRAEAVRGAWAWVRIQFFRFWTALAVLGTFGYLWVHRPEYLTWWKRTVNTVIERGCDALPYPWGDQIESTIGNFGVWVQLTLAILLFRALLGLVLGLARGAYRRYGAR
ncbi:MAG: hypothetical protein AB7F35_17260 [Acetobacteraceae bacterium]